MSWVNNGCLRCFLDRPKHNLCVYYSRLSFTGIRIMNHRQHSTDDLRVGSPRGSMSSLGCYISKAVKNLRLEVNETSSNQAAGKKDLPAATSQNMTNNYDHAVGNKLVNQNHKISSASSDDWHQRNQYYYSIIQPRSINLMPEIKPVHAAGNYNSYQRLQSGMILLKNYISLNDQVEIVNLCQEFGVGQGGFYDPHLVDVLDPGAFYDPHLTNGVTRRLLMCFGRIWEPGKNYFFLRRSDGSIAPPILDKLISLSKTTLEDARTCLKSEDEIPSMYPNTCLVNFYPAPHGHLGLHQDKHDSSSTLSRGLPVIILSIGDAAEFLYGHKYDVKNANKVLLESRDALIFGGKSRLIFHGVKKIIPDSAPLPLLKQTMLRPGRLSLALKQYK